MKMGHSDRCRASNCRSGKGGRVRITIEDAVEPEPVQLALAVYEGLSPDEIDAIEEVALDRDHFFGRRPSE